MSTRCIINFCDGAEVEAKVYRHSDGYPTGPCGVPAALKTFFAAVKRDTKKGNGGPRFNDPNYLSAKFVVWQAAQNATDYNVKTGESVPHGRALDFLSVGIMMTDPWDIEWRYFIDCSVLDAKGYPTVRWEEARAEESKVSHG